MASKPETWAEIEALAAKAEAITQKKKKYTAAEIRWMIIRDFGLENGISQLGVKTTYSEIYDKYNLGLQETPWIDADWCDIDEWVTNCLFSYDIEFASDNDDDAIPANSYFCNQIAKVYGLRLLNQIV